MQMRGNAFKCTLENPPLICGREVERVAVGLGLGADPEGHRAGVDEEAEVGALQLVLEPEHRRLGRVRWESDHNVHILKCEKGSDFGLDFGLCCIST